MKEMVGGCCVCSDERGWAENPLVYCDGHGCNVAVHQACYGIVQVPTGPWFCRKCESQERAARVRCELCPHKDGALKRTDNGGWAHVVCALYIPEVQFANVLTMEPIVLQYVPHDRFNKTCYICEEQGRESKAASGMAGLLCEEEVLEVDNVKYCGYCKYHFNKMVSTIITYIASARCLVLTSQVPVQRGITPLLSLCLFAVQCSTGHHEGSKEISEVSRSEVKVKKSSSHGASHKPKKTGSGKSTSFSSSLQGSQDFVTFPKLEQQPKEEKYRKPVSSSSSSSHLDYKVSNPVSGPSEKKHKGSKKSKHGPGRPKGSKNKEGPGAQLAGSTVTSSSPFSAGHTGTLPSLSLESPLLGSGIYTSNKDPISHGGGVLRAVCSSPLTSSLLAHQGTSSLPQLSRSAFASTLPAASSSSVSTTQVFSLAGSTFSLPSSHIFGSPLTSGLSINPLLNQTESSRTEPDLEDCSFGCRGNSPQESLSSMSPISSLPTLFDQTVSTSSGQLDNVPQATPNIEQLLEKQGNGEAGVNIVEMLKALHSLQKENLRLQEQIMTLTAKKERLQLLNVQLSVPFPVVTTSNDPASQGHYILDSLSISKSPPCKNSFGIENSLSTSSEDPHSGCPSRSSSSLSFHSTPPPLPMLQQSPASLTLSGMQQQQQVNGLARVAGSTLWGGAPAIHNLPIVDGLIGNLAGSQQLPINGILGSLNGAVQTQNPLVQTSGPPTLQLSSSLSSPLTEQQRHVLNQHEHQLQQLQQLLTSQPLNPVMV
uniref:MLLT6, PHD finger containing n=1 Tax=Sphenodon punctatus TaxID=8508 RepID=A0A8D0LBT0_SPHPU